MNTKKVPEVTITPRELFNATFRDYNNDMSPNICIANGLFNRYYDFLQSAEVNMDPAFYIYMDWDQSYSFILSTEEGDKIRVVVR